MGSVPEGVYCGGMSPDSHMFGCHSWENGILRRFGARRQGRSRMFGLSTEDISTSDFRSFFFPFDFPQDSEFKQGLWTDSAIMYPTRDIKRERDE